MKQFEVRSCSTGRGENQRTDDLAGGCDWAAENGHTWHRRSLSSSQHDYRSWDWKLFTYHGTGKTLRLSLFRFVAQINHTSYFFSLRFPFPGLLVCFSFSLSAPKNLLLTRHTSGAETWRKLPEALGRNSRSSNFCCVVSNVALRREDQSNSPQQPE